MRRADQTFGVLFLPIIVEDIGFALGDSYSLIGAIVAWYNEPKICNLVGKAKRSTSRHSSFLIGHIRYPYAVI